MVSRFIVLIAFFAIIKQAFALEVINREVRILGVSDNGKFMAVETAGILPDGNMAHAEIKILNLTTNRIRKRYDAFYDRGKIASARSTVYARAQKKLNKLKIKASNKALLKEVDMSSYDGVTMPLVIEKKSLLLDFNVNEAYSHKCPLYTANHMLDIKLSDLERKHVTTLYEDKEEYEMQKCAQNYKLVKVFLYHPKKKNLVKRKFAKRIIVQVTGEKESLDRDRAETLNHFYAISYRKVQRIFRQQRRARRRSERVGRQNQRRSRRHQRKQEREENL